MRTAVYTGTRNVYADMETAAKSLLYHNGADRVIFMIEDDEFPADLPARVITMNVSGQTYFRRDGPNYATRWTYMTLMKWTVPLTMRGRVLVLDIDTVVDGSLENLWNLPHGPLYMAREVGRTEEYYNCGVMLMDCEDLREDAARIIGLINRQRMDFAEQDATNRLMRGRIKQLPPEYNVSNWTVSPEREPVITHYAAIRHWQDRELWQRYARMTWAEAAPLVRTQR